MFQDETDSRSSDSGKYSQVNVTETVAARKTDCRYYSSTILLLLVCGCDMFLISDLYERKSNISPAVHLIEKGWAVSYVATLYQLRRLFSVECFDFKWKVAGSIPDEVIFLNLPTPSDHTRPWGLLSF
jgi:hypothetical protein